MDRYIVEGTEYDEWEHFYFSMEEGVSDRFEEILLPIPARETLYA
jgi:hypothetical protein